MAPYPTSLIPLRSLLAPWAEKALDGAGDYVAGEWAEWSGRAVHLRRRWTADEAVSVGPVCDIRGTDEAERRLAPVAHLLPDDWDEYRSER